VKPAFSVIFLTTLIGAAQGLLLALVGVEVMATAAAQSLDGLRPLQLVGTVICLALASLGLLASFFHLGRPERAWRAMASWRTSWLSREVIALPLFMVSVGAYGLSHFFGSRNSLLFGAIAVVACALLFVCTGMIYAAIRFIREWASPLTVLNFSLLGSASGLTLAATLSAWLAPSYGHILAVAALVLTIAAAAGRTASLLRNSRLRPTSTVQTALGIRHPRIVQKAQGAMGGSFNTREFFHGASVGKLRAIRVGFPLLAFLAPAILLAAGLRAESGLLLMAAFSVQFVGLILERWFFFAQANHPQNLYYQCIA